MSHSDSYVCYRQQVKIDWLSDDAVYRIRGESTGCVSYASAIKFFVCLNLVLHPTVFLICTVECTEGHIYT